MTGAEAVVKTLETHGVDYIFGYSGGAAIPFFDALETIRTSIKLIATRHEQGATHMADGYARTSGKPGVVLVTSGPGVGNIITGLMTAHMDSIPMVVLCGQQITSALGYDAFQEADVMNMTMPVVKHSFAVHDVRELPNVVAEAWHIATSGRPGPVLIDIPKDVSSAEYIGEIPQPVVHSDQSKVDNTKITAIIDAWQNAQHPLILAGHGVLISGGESELVKLAKTTNTPVVTTLLAKGAIDEHHPLSLGMLGMHGTVEANRAVEQCDFLFNIGSRFDDRIVGKASEFCKNAFIAHVDIDASEIDKIITTDISVIADAKNVASQLSAAATEFRDGWRGGGEPKLPQPSLEMASTFRRGLKRQDPSSLPVIAETQSTINSPLTMQQVIHKLDTLTAPNTIVTTDVGQHQMWAALHYRVQQPNTWLSSGGAGTMGYGFPAAIGAQLAKPDQQTIAIVGDGGFQMTLCEIATACIHKLPIKVIVLNNHYLGMVRQWQELFYDQRESGVSMEGNPDFVKLAKSYGATGVNIRTNDELENKLPAALSKTDGPVIINIEVAKTENVYPMIPAGALYSAMITEPPTTTLAKPTGST